MSRIPARPPVAPPRPGQAKVPAASAPVAPVQPQTQVAPAPVSNTEVAPVAPAPAPVAQPQTQPEVSAEPGTVATPVANAGKKGRGGRQKSERQTYHGLFVWSAPDADGNQTQVMIDDGAGGKVPQRVKLSAIPTDFDAKIHEPLKAGDFSDEALYFEFRAEQCEKQAQSFRHQAGKIRALGNAADKQKAAKLVKMRERMEALKAQLAAEGVDVEALLAADDSE